MNELLLTSPRKYWETKFVHCMAEPLFPHPPFLFVFAILLHFLVNRKYNSCTKCAASTLLKRRRIDNSNSTVFDPSTAIMVFFLPIAICLAAVKSVAAIMIVYQPRGRATKNAAHQVRGMLPNPAVQDAESSAQDTFGTPVPDPLSPALPRRRVIGCKERIPPSIDAPVARCEEAAMWLGEIRQLSQPKALQDHASTSNTAMAPNDRTQRLKLPDSAEVTQEEMVSEAIPPAAQVTIPRNTEKGGRFKLRATAPEFVPAVSSSEAPSVLPVSTYAVPSVCAHAAPSNCSVTAPHALMTTVPMYPSAVPSMYAPVTHSSHTGPSPSGCPSTVPSFNVPTVPPFHASAAPFSIAPEFAHVDFGQQSAPQYSSVPASSAQVAVSTATPGAASLHELAATNGQESAFSPAALLNEPVVVQSEPVSSPTSQDGPHRSPNSCDDVSLGDFNGAGLSNSKYKLHVSKLLAEKRPLPPPEVTTQNKRLMRALPQKRRASMNRWKRTNRGRASKQV